MAPTRLKRLRSEETIPGIKALHRFAQNLKSGRSEFLAREATAVLEQCGAKVQPGITIRHFILSVTEITARPRRMIFRILLK